MTALPNLTQAFSLIETLAITRCPNLMAIPDMQCHTCLRSLHIDYCEKLASFPELCVSLEELYISYCPAMVSFPDSTSDVALQENDDDGIQSLPSADGIQRLQLVVLKGWPELKSLPRQLQHLSALKYLELYSFDGLESLPEWLGGLSSLQSLSISYCKMLTYMPSVDAMRRLTKLSKIDNLLLSSSTRKMHQRFPPRVGEDFPYYYNQNQWDCT